ncbi:MAG: hypothetical protein DI552_04990 [Brevundimonas sp.]|uniref:GNAT family N-acetyltransferase n=1 Tax=Brevundimonas albigilva TaxID=1312364 RepID=A0ABY4ST04_9CAUL|nr:MULTISPECIES: hypothetical protein [Brevundimonas]PZU60075.1 MAG: hypothetical protein DI552_04990 [Brevundimonas sp.]UQV19148.1 hypothetical protein MU852_04760 [Brevundimonas albigilva]URI15978.1 hypothetical protein M8231_03025 [Brevundimonas albigilva]
MAPRIRRLEPDDALLSYALARLATPDLALSDWEARLAQDEGCGGLYALFEADAPCALLSYSRAIAHDGTDLFVVDWIAAFDLLSPDRVAESLIGAFRELHASGPARVAWCPKPPASTFDRAVARAGSLHSVL